MLLATLHNRTWYLSRPIRFGLNTLWARMAELTLEVFRSPSTGFNCKSAVLGAEMVQEMQRTPSSLKMQWVLYISRWAKAARLSLPGSYPARRTQCMQQDKTARPRRMGIRSHCGQSRSRGEGQHVKLTGTSAVNAHDTHIRSQMECVETDALSKGSSVRFTECMYWI
jgi:hypothetical protein